MRMWDVWGGICACNLMLIVCWWCSLLRYHGLKQIFEKGSKSKKLAASFVVFIAKSKMFGQTAFFALEGKSNWSADKIKFVKETMDHVVKQAYMNASLEDHTAELSATADVFEIPKSATTHRVKYIGGTAVDSKESAHCQRTLLKMLASDTTDMKKTYQGKDTSACCGLFARYRSRAGKRQPSGVATGNDGTAGKPSDRIYCGRSPSQHEQFAAGK